MGGVAGEWATTTDRRENAAGCWVYGGLWTRAIVPEGLQRELGVRASDATVGRGLRAWGLSVHKPLRRAYEQDPAQVQQWLDQTYPAGQQHAHDPDAEVYFGDESGVGSTDHSGTTWGGMGDTPVGPGDRPAVSAQYAFSGQCAGAVAVYAQYRACE